VPRQELSRTKAADFVSRRLGQKVAHTVLAYWEAQGLLPKTGRGRGRWTPAIYTVRELVVAEVVARLRRDGASLQRVKKAKAALLRLMPELEVRTGELCLAVTSLGEAVLVQTLADVMQLFARAPGQMLLMDARELVAAAQQEIERRAITPSRSEGRDVR
jgi:DNA-binding transcriptional MerR regulator